MIDAQIVRAFATGDKAFRDAIASIYPESGLGDLEQNSFGALMKDFEEYFGPDSTEASREVLREEVQVNERRF